MPDADHESQYLVLCQGFEGLRRECPCDLRQVGYWGRCLPCLEARKLENLHSGRCFECDGHGWLPRPEPERLGALVEWCHQQGHDVVLSPGFATVIDHEGDQDGEGPEPWQALTAALTEARAEEAA